jgi:hypothetical protein
VVRCLYSNVLLYRSTSKRNNQLSTPWKKGKMEISAIKKSNQNFGIILEDILEDFHAL